MELEAEVDIAGSPFQTMVCKKVTLLLFHVLNILLEVSAATEVWKEISCNALFKRGYRSKLRYLFFCSELRIYLNFN